MRPSLLSAAIWLGLYGSRRAWLRWQWPWLYPWMDHYTRARG